MLHGVLLAADGDGRVGVGARVGVDEQRIALGVVLAALEAPRDVDEAAVRAAALADGDGFGDDGGRGFVGGMDHLGAGVLVLAVVGEGDGDDLAAGLAALEHDPRIFDGQPAADIAVDPLDLGLLVGETALGDEIVDVGRPVLDGDVLDLGALEGDELDHGAVQRGGGELRRGAALHVGELAALVDDDEGALKLAEVLGVDAEIGLERVRDLHAGRHVDEGAAGEDGAVERGKLVVAGRDDLAEPLAEDLRVRAEGLGGVDEDDALLRNRFLDVGIGGLAVELGLDAGEVLALLLGDAEALEGLLDVCRDLVPGARGLGALGEVITDLVEVDVL